MDLSNVFNTGGMVTGIGLLIVFTCLISLIVIMVIMPKIINRKKVVKPSRQKTAKEKKVVAASAPTIETRSIPYQKDEGELVAVLSAAVAAILDTQSSNIVLRSYKRVSPSAWKKSGRDYQIFNKF